MHHGFTEQWYKHIVLSYINNFFVFNLYGNVNKVICNFMQVVSGWSTEWDSICTICSTPKWLAHQTFSQVVAVDKVNENILTIDYLVKVKIEKPNREDTETSCISKV